MGSPGHQSRSHESARASERSKAVMKAAEALILRRYEQLVAIYTGKIFSVSSAALTDAEDALCEALTGHRDVEEAAVALGARRVPSRFAARPSCVPAKKNRRVRTKLKCDALSRKRKSGLFS